MENNYDNNQTSQGYAENYGTVNQGNQGYNGNYSTTATEKNGYKGNYGTTNQESQEYSENNYTTTNSQKYDETTIQNGQEYDGKQWKNGTYNSNQNTTYGESNYEKGVNQYGSDLNYVTKKNKNVSSIYGNIYNTSNIPQEKADSITGVIEQPTYVGGFFGTTSQEPQQSQYSQTGTYVGGYINNSQTTNDTKYYDDCETQSAIAANEKTNLPVKRTFWSKVKTFLFGTEVTIEITEKEQNILTKIHDFLFQDISLKGFLNILKIGNDKKKNQN